MISWEHHPNNEGIIDVMTNVLFESSDMNHHADGYAMEVVHHYFDTVDGDDRYPFSDEWYREWIATEEFRSGRYPTGSLIPSEMMLQFEKMYDMYWMARTEWFNLMIQNIARKNLEEMNRMGYSQTLHNNTRWGAIKHYRMIDHNQED